MDKPTYPKYKKGGCKAKPGSCKSGLRPTPSIGAGSNLKNGLEPKNKNEMIQNNLITVQMYQLLLYCIMYN